MRASSGCAQRVTDGLCVDTDAELSFDGNEDEGMGDGGDVDDLDASVDLLEKGSDDDAELLGSSLIHSSLADKAPRWRQHDSETKAAAEAAKRGGAGESSDEEGGDGLGSEGDAGHGGGLSPGEGPADGAMQFGFES